MDEHSENSSVDIPIGLNAVISENDRLLVLLAHLGIFFLPGIFPLVLLIIKKDSSSFIYHHLKQAVFWQVIFIISLITRFYQIWYLVSANIFGVIIFKIMMIQEFIFLPVFFMTFAIIASKNSYNLEWYNYPLLD